MKIKLQKKDPIFLVGCPRSGTTLLQSLLAAHSEIASFPETKFFQYLSPEYEPRRQKLSLASKRLKPWLEVFFRESIQRPEMLSSLPRIPLMTFYTQQFLKIMNTLTEEQGKQIWLEKTPEHIHYIEYIEKVIPGVKFLHITRSGLDVVASLYDVSHKYPEFWMGGLDIDTCIKRWTEAMEITQRHLHKHNHMLVRYEQLVEDPATILKNLCKFIEIEFEETMVHNYGAAAEQVTLKREQWKKSVNKVITNANSTKFYQIFDEAERKYIQEQVSRVKIPTSSSPK